jgi:hypothetical protein
MHDAYHALPAATRRAPRGWSISDIIFLGKGQDIRQRALIELRACKPQNAPRLKRAKNAGHIAETADHLGIAEIARSGVTGTAERDGPDIGRASAKALQRASLPHWDEAFGRFAWYDAIVARDERHRNVVGHVGHGSGRRRLRHHRRPPSTLPLLGPGKSFLSRSRSALSPSTLSSICWATPRPSRSQSQRAGAAGFPGRPICTRICSISPRIWSMSGMVHPVCRVVSSGLRARSRRSTLHSPERTSRRSRS